MGGLYELQIQARRAPDAAGRYPRGGCGNDRALDPHRSLCCAIRLDGRRSALPALLASARLVGLHQVLPRVPPHLARRRVGTSPDANCLSLQIALRSRARQSRRPLVPLVGAQRGCLPRHLPDARLQAHASIGRSMHEEPCRRQRDPRRLSLKTPPTPFSDFSQTYEYESF